MKRIGVFLSITILLSVLAGSGVAAAPTVPGGLLVAEASEENIELIGHLGGPVQTIEVRDQYAYVGIGQEFAVLDISDPAHVQRVGWLLAAGEVMDIAIQGDYAYIAYAERVYYAAEVGMQVINIRNPALPASISVMLFTGSEVYDCGMGGSVVLQGNDAFFLYTACSVFGRIIIGSGERIVRLDVTYPAHPVILNTYSDLDRGINHIAVSGRWLYALIFDPSRPYDDQTHLVVFDASTPEMVEVASIDSYVNGLTLTGNYALTTGDNVLQVVDVSDPAHPNTVATHVLQENVGEIFTQGTTAYLVQSSSILILDISDVFNPVNLGVYNTVDFPWDIAAHGETVYTALYWEGIEIFDSASLSLLGLVDYEPQTYKDFAAAGSYAYAATDEGLEVLEISDTDAPLAVSHLEILSPTVSLVLGGSFAYLASPADGIHVVDISDPLNPAQVAYYPLPLDLRQLVQVENKLYVAAGWNGLRILDASDPYQLEELGGFAPEYSINALAVAGRYAYAATSINTDQMVVLDVSDPDSPEEVGAYDPPGSEYQAGSAVAVQGDLVLYGMLHVAPTPLSGVNSGQVWAVDVSDPEEPREVAWTCCGAPKQIIMEGSYAYVVYEVQGLTVYDISGPAVLKPLGGFDPSEYTYALAVAGDRIYIGNESLFVLRFADPNLPSFGGVVIHTNGQPYPGVPVSIGGILPDKVSDMQGAYAFRGAPEGTYTLTPSLPGYVFHPPSRTVSVPPNAFGQNFTILPEPVQLDFTPGISTTLRYTDTQGLPTWLDIPGDASASPLTLQVVPTIGAGAPGYAFTGHAFELNASPAGERAAGFVFNAPLTAAIQYSAWDVTVITDPDNLALWWWDGTAWQDAAQSCSPASEYSRDPANYTLSLPICQTGTYKLMGPTQQVHLPLIFSDD